DLPRARVLHEPFRSPPEVQPHRGGPFRRGERRVLGPHEAADLDDEVHDPASRVARAAPGSGPRMRLSPTSMASMPAARSACTSAGDLMPLSATTSRLWG